MGPLTAHNRKRPTIPITIKTTYSAEPGSGGYPDCETIEDCLAVDEGLVNEGEGDALFVLIEQSEIDSVVLNVAGGAL